ncbi:MAG TPA: M48 family metallopeptidase [Bacteroidia bacterium]|jgi:hypothetical protein|nr:M48 family metallopeptidase [Bacteroidia bacterium]
MKRLFLVPLFLLQLGHLFAQQDLDLNYVPLNSSGVLPEVFSKKISDIVNQDINGIAKEDADKKLKSDYVFLTEYAIERKVKSGNTLINDEITRYINEIVDILLADQPELRKKINVFALKSSVVNAYCYDKGYLFVDIGLISMTQSEAQIAEVLSHEIMHYVKQHVITRYIHNEKLEESQEGKTDKALAKEMCQFSKEQESEADLEGYKLLEKTKYDLQNAKDFFSVLQYYHLPFELKEFKNGFLESENFKIPDSYFLKDVAPIKDNTNEDDTLHTHPNCTKRRLAIENYIKDKSSEGRIKNILGEQRFLYIRDLARFETCRLQLKNRNYGAALYSAYLLLQKYPENLFLAQTISKCLYGISLYRAGYLRYNRDSYLDGPTHYLEVESHPQQLYYLINKMPDNEWNVMALNYTYRQHKKFPNDEVLTILSDSLFSIMTYTNCELDGFGNIAEKIVNVNPIKDTTSYYKLVFKDLFLKDPEFVKKFPKTVGKEIIFPYTPKSYKVKRLTKYIKEFDKISQVMSVAPFYLIFKDGEETDYFVADEQQQKLTRAIIQSAKSNEFKIDVLDPVAINANEVNKLNDFSVVNDWLYERMDGSDNEKSFVPVFCVNGINDIINRYGTHLLKTGFVCSKGKRNEYVFITIIYDLKENREVYVKQELIGGSPPTEQEMKDKLMALFKELKSGIKQK